MENFDRENIDELLEIRQIRQYFAPYGTNRMSTEYLLDNVVLQLHDGQLIMITNTNCQENKLIN